MNYTTAVFLINKDLRAVTALYEPGGKVETFKTLDATVSPGDVCVTTTDTRLKFTTVKVLDVDVAIDFDDPAKVRWIVAKVDVPAFDKIVNQESEAIEAIKSAEFRKRRATLFSDLVADKDAAAIKALPIYKNGES